MATNKGVNSGDKRGQIQAILQMTTRIGNQTADIQSRLFTFITAHGTVAFFDPPTNGAFRGIVDAIQDLAAVASFQSR